MMHISHAWMQQKRNMPLQSHQMTQQSFLHLLKSTVWKNTQKTKAGPVLFIMQMSTAAILLAKKMRPATPNKRLERDAPTAGFAACFRAPQAKCWAAQAPSTFRAY